MRDLGNGKLVTSHPYWLSVDVGLTGVAAETKANNTAEALEELVLVGGSTNLGTTGAGTETKVRIWEFIQIAPGQSGPMRMSASTPLLALFGKRDSAKPYIYFPNWKLRKGNKLRTEVLNSTANPESRGWLVFAAEPSEPRGAVVDKKRVQGEALFAFTLSMNLTATASEQKATPSDAFDRDVLIIGAYTDTDGASIGVRLTGADGQAWCPPDEHTPMWAVAGRNSSQHPLMRWATPYLLPAGGILRASFKNAVAADTPESNGTITFVGYEL